MVNQTMYNTTIPFTTAGECPICGRPEPSPVLDLPGFPLTEIYTDHRQPPGPGLLDQTLTLCEDCGHAQLLRRVTADTLYGHQAGYSFRTSSSPTGPAAVGFFFDFLTRRAGGRQYRRALDVGANDLYLARKLQARAERVLAVDPMLRHLEVRLEAGIEIIPDYIENVVLDETPDLIVCKDVLEHLADPVAVLAALTERADHETDIFVQMPILDALVAGGRFDQITHQHLHYFSLHSFQKTLDRLGCRLLDHAVNHWHWGTAVFHFRKDPSAKPVMAPQITRQALEESFEVFRGGLAAARRRLDLQAAQGPVYAYGAALTLPVTMYWLDLMDGPIKNILDDDERKRSRWYLNLPYQVLLPGDVDDLEQSTVMLTAFQARLNLMKIMAGSIVQKARHLLIPAQSL